MKKQKHMNIFDPKSTLGLLLTLLAAGLVSQLSYIGLDVRGRCRSNVHVQLWWHTDPLTEDCLVMKNSLNYTVLFTLIVLEQIIFKVYNFLKWDADLYTNQLFRSRQQTQVHILKVEMFG